MIEIEPTNCDDVGGIVVRWAWMVYPKTSRSKWILAKKKSFTDIGKQANLATNWVAQFVGGATNNGWKDIVALDSVFLDWIRLRIRPN